MTANEIRDSFKSFFESKGHQIVPSAPMVIKDDPTLMFTNAGMNQFKDIILGNHPAKYKRVADSQKCLRVSGKHNDLEEVGHDTYHHTMFEMLGNWSFGDYFKKEAISWAWEYLVDVLKLDPKDLYATVFEGSAEEGLERDNEAASYWEQFLPKDHILNGNKHDNFWEMGDTGPCGPCSEIHVDSRSEEEKAKVPGSQLVNKDHPQVIEIWNLVFMQFNRKADGSLEGLPAKVIDTGMGFERLVRTLQGKTSNYDTDVFQPILKAIGDMAGKKYGEDEKSDIAMRVIADHIRTIAFSITDGQLPSNAKQVTSSVVSSAVPCATVTRSSDRSRHSCTSSSPYSSRTWRRLSRTGCTEGTDCQSYQGRRRFLPPHPGDGYPPAGKDHGRCQIHRQERNQRKGCLYPI